jgi:uncharacterized membrane protein YiaA
MKMKPKKIIGIVAIVIGAIILLLGLYARNRVAEARGNVQSASSLFPNNPVDKQISGSLEKQIGAYDSPVMWTIVGGIAIVIIGIGTLMRKGKK